MGEVKGRLLTEKQVDRIVTLLARNEAVFEVTALDLGLHKEVAARDYQRKLGEGMLAKVPNFREDVRPEVQAASEYINKAPVNLFLQALTTFDVLHRVIGRVTSSTHSASLMSLAPFRGLLTVRIQRRPQNGKSGGRTTRRALLQQCQREEGLGCCLPNFTRITRSMKNSA